MSWIYKQTERQLWTVGTLDASGKFEPESDHDSPTKAAERVRYLNGGAIQNDPQIRTSHAIRAGMMWVEDYKSPPNGRVVIHADERFIHIVAWEIRGSLEIVGLFVRTVGIDTLPGFTHWCDSETAAAVQAFLIDNDLWEPEQWGEWYRRERFGKTYLQRRHGMR